MDPHKYCSKSAFYKSQFLKSKEIDQTPLLHHYDVGFYLFDLNVENNSVYVSGSVSMIAKVVAEQLDTVAFELIDQMVIDSVFINGSKLDFFRESDEVFVPLFNPIGQGSDFETVVFYYGTPPTGNFFSGVSSVFDSTWNKNVTWTLSEPFNAREWWPTKQVLTDKADSVWVFLTTSNENKAGSNGLLTNVVSLPNNKVRYEWKSRYPIAYYLISFAVAEYQEYNVYAHIDGMNGDSLLIQNFIYDSPGCLTNYKAGLDRTVPVMELFSDLYSMYPFHEEKYGHCLTALSGGMEHQTMTTIGGFGLGIVSHELGHMWFGDNVTCATWSDIWINEGFATYSDYLAHEKIAGDHWPHLWLTLVHNNVLLSPEGSVYVPPEEVQYDNVLRIFNSKLSYHKGALLLHMIRYELNDDDLFFQVYKNFQEQFADSVATGLDFMHVLNEISGLDFTQFFDQWYFGEGYPVYYISWDQDGSDFTFESVQTTTVPEVTPFFRMPLPCRLYFSDGSDTTIVFQQSENEMTFNFQLEKQIDSLAVDPELWVLKKVAYLNNVQTTNISDLIRIFPNPVTHHLYLDNPHQLSIRLEVMNVGGKSVANFESMQHQNRVDLSDLTSGIYFLKMETENISGVFKIIKL
jgi:aminopeptidase N